ncbi:heat-inducible transcriptional repressor HrcA [Aeromicrobium sp. Leaf350]|uniref:heat-inducible transcriptional repressor HrcA n=1 Tax=Aeromicrobium sp. Leaf350 TaxID=2876565 RepID=UPI001E4C6E4C|nr:heat-inducible transcriptional repressor HrcA [Aeromicrobium sp. Leaf350]
MSDDRRLDVLRAIVEDYVATQEPVGSRALVERHHLGVSPATIRNDMAVLEDEGYLTQPHTSAGRIPTDKGYRMFVDRLATVKALSPAERRAIERFLSESVDVDDIVQRSVRVLSQLTSQVAVVQYPSLTRSTVRHVEVVALDGDRALVVVITSSGRVEQRTIDLPSPLTDQLLADLRSRLMPVVLGERLSEAAVKVADLIHTFEPVDQPLVAAVVATLTQTFSDERSDARIVVGGTSNLARYGAEFDTTVRPVLEALEEQVVLLKLLGEVSGGVTVRIGGETGFDTLAGNAVVASAYGGDGSRATLATVGPARMDYPGTMAAVAAVARYVGRMLDDA